LYVYKGELADGTKIVVKRKQFEMVGDKGLNEFRSEIARFDIGLWLHFMAIAWKTMRDLYCLKMFA
jgi:hypothetical protein